MDGGPPPSAPMLPTTSHDGCEEMLCAEHFAVGEWLGEGGFGTVHRATFLATGQEVAIKILPDALSDTLGVATEVELLRACPKAPVAGF